MVNLLQISFYLTFLLLDPREFHKGECRAFKSECSLFFVNRAFVCTPAPEVVQQVKDFYGPHPHAVWTDRDDQIAKERLLAAGYTYFTTSPIMVADLSAIAHSPIQPAVTIRELQDDPAELELWLTVLEQIRLFDKEECRKFFNYLRSTPEWQHMRLYIAYLDGVPVAMSMAIIHGDIVGLHWVGTMPQFRRRGLGTAVSAYPLQELAKQGVKQAVLLASDMGKSVYEKIGFKTIGALDVYKPAAN